jgi:hypothetical protein
VSCISCSSSIDRAVPVIVKVQREGSINGSHFCTNRYITSHTTNHASQHKSQHCITRCDMTHQQYPIPGHRISCASRRCVFCGCRRDACECTTEPSLSTLCAHRTQKYSRQQCNIYYECHQFSWLTNAHLVAIVLGSPSATILFTLV